jgi:hypothetical protein
MFNRQLTQVGHTGPLCPSEVGRPVPVNHFYGTRLVKVVTEQKNSTLTKSLSNSRI